MTVHDWVRLRVEFGVGHSFASQIEKHFRREAGERVGTPAVYHALAAVAAEHGIVDCDGGFRCRMKTLDLDEPTLIDAELDALLLAARRRKIVAIINDCYDLLSESDMRLVEAILDNYL